MGLCKFLMMTRLESKLAQTHVALTGPTRQQVLQLMMTRLESKLAQTHVVLTGPMRQQVLQLMMTTFGLILSFLSNRQLCMVLEGKSSQEHQVILGFYEALFLVIHFPYLK